MDKKHEGRGVLKMKLCKEANYTLLFIRLQNNFLYTPGPFMVQISAKNIHKNRRITKHSTCPNYSKPILLRV